MKALLKKILRAVNLYHPLQLFYRQQLFIGKRTYLRFRYRKRKGNTFTCNACGHAYSTFAPDYPSSANRLAIRQHQVIAGYGENIICPYCLSVARERLVLAMLAEMDLAGKKILHLSPEKNIYRFLAATANVQTADLLPGYYKNIDPEIVKADATKLPFPAENFDIVIANHILEHIPDDRQALKEIFRILKTPGIAVLQIPFSTSIGATLEDPYIANPRKQSLLFGQEDHVRIYSFDDYCHRLRETGFTVHYHSYESLLPLHRYGIQPGEGFFRITKQAAGTGPG